MLNPTSKLYSFWESLSLCSLFALAAHLAASLQHQLCDTPECGCKKPSPKKAFLNLQTRYSRSLNQRWSLEITRQILQWSITDEVKLSLRHLTSTVGHYGCLYNMRPSCAETATSTFWLRLFLIHHLISFAAWIVRVAEYQADFLGPAAISDGS